MDKTIFKAYDIRGRYPKELDEETARAVGQSMGKHWKRGKIVVAHDARTSSPTLYAAVIEGLLENSNLEIEKVNLSTTPMFYFLVNDSKAVGGVMVTASHNPKEFNGLKIVGPRAELISGKDVLALML